MAEKEWQQRYRDFVLSRNGFPAIFRLTEKRLVKTFFIILLAVLLLVGKLVYLQVVKAGELSEVASVFRERSYEQEARRGDILDANGAILAKSVTRYNVRVDQKLIKHYVYKKNDEVMGTGAAAAAKQLSPILGIDQAELGGILLGGVEKGQWVKVAADISPDTWQEINKLDITGIYPERYMKRLYPNGKVAAPIIGFLGQTDEDTTIRGRAGIEQQFDTVLAGKNGKLTVEVGPDGTVFPYSKRQDIPSVDGRNVRLTIDRDLQQVAEKALENSVRGYKAQWGSAVVIEIATGRVLAMADSSLDGGKLPWTSRAVSAVLEPGSAGKVVTYGTAINEGVVKPTDIFTNPYRYRTADGETIKDNSPHDTVNMTVSGIMAKSYNTGLVQIGTKIPAKTRYQYLRNFGFGQKTGIELPSENSGILRPYEQWDRRSNYTSMFGQSYAVTPLQLAQMAAIIGNKGMRVPVHIIDGVYDEKGNYVRARPKGQKRVLSTKSADVMLKMMQGVTQQGSTGLRAAVDKYNVAGKTGTAQVINSSGQAVANVGTFAGVIPADNPKIAMSVMVYTKQQPGYGGTLAAPVFANVAKFAMRQMHIAPSSAELYRYPWYANEVKKD